METGRSTCSQLEGQYYNGEPREGVVVGTVPHLSASVRYYLHLNSMMERMRFYKRKLPAHAMEEKGGGPPTASYAERHGPWATTRRRLYEPS